MISGYTVGNWLIGPGVLINENFDISYGLGNLTIVPALLSVKANDTTADCTGVQPQYAFTNSIYQYEDADSNVVASGPDFIVQNDQQITMGNGNLQTGTYTIIPSNLVQQGAVPNYTLEYVSGILTVDSLPDTPVVTVVNNCNGTFTLSTTAAGNLLWSTGETTQSITVNTAGDYTVTSTAGGCTSLPGTGTAAPGTGLDTPVVTVEDNCNGHRPSLQMLPETCYGTTVLLQLPLQ